MAVNCHLSAWIHFYVNLHDTYDANTEKKKIKKITKQKVPFMTRKFKNDALEEIWTSSIVMMLLETESIKN